MTRNCESRIRGLQMGEFLIPKFLLEGRFFPTPNDEAVSRGGGEKRVSG